MTFTGGTDFAMHYHKYASKMGFSYHICTSVILPHLVGKVGKNVTGLEANYENLQRIRFKCSHVWAATDDDAQGCSDADDDVDARGCQTIRCGAFVDASMSEGMMVIKTLSNEHNHDMDPSHSRFMPNYRFLTL